MSNANKLSHTPTRGRTVLPWFWLSVALAAAVLICAALVWAAVPRQPRLALGPLRDLPTHQPEYRPLADNVAVYAVNLDGTPVAWDARAPVTGNRCRYRWVPTNNRFEDPCSGNKWCLDGTVADDRYGPVRTLDRYEVEVDRDGQVWLRPGRQATGTPATPPQGKPYYCEPEHR